MPGEGRRECLEVRKEFCSKKKEVDSILLNTTYPEGVNGFTM